MSEQVPVEPQNPLSVPLPPLPHEPQNPLSVPLPPLPHEPQNPLSDLPPLPHEPQNPLSDLPPLPHEPQNDLPPLPHEPQNPLSVPLPPLPQPPTNSMPELPIQSSNSGSERLMFKNRLQEYTQKSSLQLPLYHTVNEGAQHSPEFRSTVLVDGTSYTSQQTFAQRKSAEQDAARVALENIPQKLKDHTYPIIREDTTFCKSILNEYSVKMHLDKPLYQTIQPEGLLPVFVSSLVFNGVSYTGNEGRNKKEAEQLAARAVILSILDSADSECVNVMYEIIKSKYRLYAALNKIKDTDSYYSSALLVVNKQKDTADLLNKRKDAEVTSNTVNLPINESCLNELGKVRDEHLPLHQFKKPKHETSTETVARPIVFVPPGSTQALVASTSGAKRNRKNKKKAKSGLQIGPQMAAAIIPLTSVPPCSVAP